MGIEKVLVRFIGCGGWMARGWWYGQVAPAHNIKKEIL
jgi:hypothetical protein